MFLSDTQLNHLAQVAAEPDLSGTRYTLGPRIGKGGMGAVYQAHDARLGREVALKVSAALGPDLAERLEREAQTIAQLEHPGIVPVHDAGVLPDGRVYYAMKLVRGQRLDVWARAHELKATLRLLQRVCEAVAFAHARGVLHRDLKPENVMVGEFGEALVMDWGLAKLFAAPPTASDALAPPAPTADPLATVPGSALGTPAYMAPEQARGDLAAVGTHTDVYGLGATLYAVLAGAPPGPAPAPLPAGLPRPLVSICSRAMAAAPADRYPGARELGEDLGRWLEQERVLAHQETFAELTLRFASRHRVVLGLGAAYLLARLLVLAWS
jgi:eukaryotic-like serine/threonine-protein kinase